MTNTYQCQSKTPKRTDYLMIEALNRDPRIAVMGCGHWGKNLVRNFAELGYLAAVVDPNSDLACKFADEYSVKAMSADEAIASDDIDAIVIAAPAEMHAEIAINALNAGKHVYCEKPLALEEDDANAMIAAAKENKRSLMVGHLLQYHPVFASLRERVQNGDLGRLQYIYSNRMSLGKIRREENVFWSFAPHDLSMVLSLAGEEPERVQATGHNVLHEELYDMAHANIHFKSGLYAHVFTSWLNPFKEQKLVVAGEKGMFVFDDTEVWENKLMFYGHTIEWTNQIPTPNKADGVPVPVEQSEPLKSECQHFADSVKNGTAPLTDGEEGLRVLKVLDAAQMSMEADGYDVYLDEDYEDYELMDEDGYEVYLDDDFEDEEQEFFVHESSYVDDNVEIGEGTKIWHFSHVLGGTKIGQNCNVGQNVVLGANVTIGNGCKIQNNVSVYEGVELADGVFCGPSCVFTNVNTPRAEVNRQGEYLPTKVEKGVTIGANATIVCGNALGAYSFIAAGAVVTQDVKPHALMAGVPAKQLGWVSQAGEILRDDMTCPRTGEQYAVQNDQLVKVSNSEGKAA